MAKKIEVIGQALVITDESIPKVLFDVPKGEVYYNSDLLINEGIIKINNIDILDNANKTAPRILLSDAIDSSDTPFTVESFISFARTNLGFKTASGGSGAVDSVNGETGVVVLNQADIPFTPYKTITSTDGQAAVEGLKDELDAAILGNGTTTPPQSRTTVGGETSWTVSGNITTSHQLFVNGVKLVEGVDYTYTTNIFTFDASYLPIGIEEQEYYPNISVVGTMDTTNNSIIGYSQTATGDGTTTIDWSLGNTFNFQFGAFNEVFTFTDPSKSGTFILKLVQDEVGSRTVTFPSSVKWSGGTAPTLTTTATTGTDIITFYFDGVSYFAVEVLDFS